MAYDTERVNEVRVLLHTAQGSLPNWIAFTTDYDVELKRIVHFLLTNDRSPMMEWRRDGRPLYRSVIEWRTADGWTTQVTAPPVHRDGGRLGRIRFRKPRSKETP